VEIIESTERLERALLQSVSHELKTPLSVVGTGVDALAKMVVPNERSQATLREIQQALRRLHRVINNLLNMTRIESGAVHPQLDWCEVGEVIDAAKDLAADVVGSHRVEVDIDRSLPMVRIDQPLLEQCLSNLLLNAASNSAAGSEIQINARVADDRLVISVRDEGKGVTESELPHIFETFYRGAEARPGGTGLGLAIVDGFTRALGGSVTAANKRPHGAEFVITIPVETLRPDVMEKLA
jgi:two-component system sensor histidine kinase KdpD